MNACIRAGIQKHLPVISDNAGVPDIESCLRQCDRLVEALPAAVFMQLVGCHRLSAHDDMRNTIGIVYIQ